MNQKVQILYRSRFEFANSLAGTTASRVDICMCTYLCGGRINRKDALIKVDKYVIMTWKQKTKTPYMQTLKLWKNWYSALNGYEGGVNWLLNLLRASKQKPAKEDQQQQNLATFGARVRRIQSKMTLKREVEGGKRHKGSERENN